MSLNVRDIMSRNIISVEPDEHISQALSKMEKNRLHQLLVMGNGSLYGMIELKKVVLHDIDIASSKVSGFASNVPQIDANATIESAAQLLLSSGVRALPVTDSGKVVGVISETDLMKVANQFVKIDRSAEEIINQAIYVDKDDNYGAVKRLFAEKNIARVPVVDKDKILGVVSTLEIIKILHGNDRMSARGGLLKEQGAKQKLRLEETPIASLVRPAVTVSGDTSIGKVIELLTKNEEVIVKTEAKFGIITPKDIIELFVSSPKKGVYVQITGMHDESIEFKAKMDSIVTEFVSKMGKIEKNMEYLVVHVEKMHKQGGKYKYSVRVRFKHSGGFFVAHAWGWKPIDVIQEAFDKMGREVVSKHGKNEVMSKSRKRKEHYE